MCLSDSFPGPLLVVTLFGLGAQTAQPYFSIFEVGRLGVLWTQPCESEVCCLAFVGFCPEEVSRQVPLQLRVLRWVSWPQSCPGDWLPLCISGQNVVQVFVVLLCHKGGTCPCVPKMDGDVGVPLPHRRGSTTTALGLEVDPPDPVAVLVGGRRAGCMWRTGLALPRCVAS